MCKTVCGISTFEFTEMMKDIEGLAKSAKYSAQFLSEEDAKIALRKLQLKYEKCIPRLSL